ncbi:MAG: aminotransferase class V-fold PLP-dependent enzyme [Pseudomonadota bacterium]
MADKQADRPIYLDYQATTPSDPRVMEAMLPYLSRQFGNPHSIQHTIGLKAEAAVEKARGQVADLINAESREVIFTSGATEANNLAIKGVAAFQKGRRGHAIVAVTEHKCVLESYHRLEREGWRVTYLPVSSKGLLDMKALTTALDEDTALVSVMAVNNEIGVIQPLDEIGALCREKKAAFHCDAAQAAGKIPLDVEAAKIDLLSISGHKLYGPMGIGALYVRRRPRVRLEPLFDGGGQERGLRSGTLPLFLCVGFGEACALAQADRASEGTRLAALSARLWSGLTAELDGLSVNGDQDRRFAGNLNISFAGVDAEALIKAMPEIAVSTGSACTSASVEPSYVLQALNLEEERTRSALRIGLGRFSTAEEIDRAVAIIVRAVTDLRGRAGRDGNSADGSQAAE